ncbi:MAG: 4-hydroxy-tetrahydrodipicolinate synthase [Propionibacteriaceae bacterium]|nr:4-hydroxy-tetrahydrodipicolinate synthase [Propionibacteriaceae bacterium]
MSKQLKGVLTALATPFDVDENIDVEAFKAVVERSVSAGVGGVVACGSTGEVGTMNSDERRQVVDIVVEQTAGRGPVIAQTGATSTAEAIRLSKAAQASGADVLMLVTPYYEAVSVDETVAYLKAVAAAVDLPIMLYNIPSATGVNLSPDIVRQLATEIDQVKYIKDSSANYEQALQLIHYHSDVIGTFIGWDVYLYSALVEGAAGIMAGAANVVPSELVSVARLIADGELSAVFAEWQKVYPVIDALISTAFISGVKAGLALQGTPAGVPRRPVAPYGAEDEARLAAALAALKQP